MTNKQDLIQRLCALAKTSIFVSNEREATEEENREFARLLQEALSQGMRFDGLELIDDDGCSLCLEEKKQIVYEALETGPRQRSGLTSVRIDFADLIRSEGPVH